MTETLTKQSLSVDSAARLLAAGELNEAGLEAIQFLREVVASDAVELKHRIKAATALKGAAGFAPYSAKTLEAKAAKPLTELSSAELRDRVQGAMRELADRATPAQIISPEGASAEIVTQAHDIF